MVIHTDRSAAEEQLVAALRAAFDASVMNFGSYNILYAQNLLGGETGGEATGGSEPSAQETVAQAPHLLVGYRRGPLEMVLCPVDLEAALARVHAISAGEGSDQEDVRPSMPVTVNLTNLAAMSADDDVVEITLSTGRKVKLRMCGEVRFDGLSQVRLRQQNDVEDFNDFLDEFFDTVELMGH
ncbi:hypothetical protein [Nesterenkonia flava]|uniref:Uncharacterized protein n=1 Tax=Nesterenkonia flava TaxID=469799 RepID=A0ABU1FS41_9MICC|nr:hypothetical protein [Nesterenkonia flava]MDR5711439.1 hypothetical protein [Nesterenkonia flava]